MAIEIEAKMKVPTLQPLRDRLNSSGATFLSDVLEHNIFFDTPSQSLFKSDKGLRIRQTTDPKTGITNCKITFKGPRHKGQLKSRDEVELSAEPFDQAAALLTGLGYQQILSFQKKRETWQLQNCLVELDELPYIGTFIEIEGPTDAAVIQVRQLLQLHNVEMLQTSYVALLFEYLTKHKIPDRQIVWK